MTPWTVACQAPLSMTFFRQEYWSGLPFPLPGDLLNLGIELSSPEFSRRILYQDASRKAYTGKEFTYHCRRCKRRRFDPWVGKIPWERNGNPLQCSCWEIPWTEELAGYSPWGLKDSDMTEHKHRVSIIP